MHNIHQVIFDGIVLYDKETAQLTNLLNTDKTATLTVPANECLAIIIKNSPEITTQKQLFNDVWESHGIPINSNTFYQNISIIRKAFKQVDYEPDVLVTIPRRGIEISKAIQYEITSLYDNEREPRSQLVSPVTTVVNTKSRKKPHYFIVLPFFLTLFVMVAWFFYSYHIKTTSPFYNYKYIEKYNGCNIYGNERYSHEFLGKILTTIDLTSCFNDEKIYISVYANLPRISMIKCDNDIYLPQSICSSSYYYLENEVK
ncbi:transcriptional regulator [Providencia alcalifaciens]